MKNNSPIGRILVMDDEVMILDVAGKILSRLGYEVEFAESGEQAISCYVRARECGKRFDLVIVDLTVPEGMGGMDTVSRLRELDPSLKAIVSSGSFDDPVMLNFTEYGFNLAISKPYTIKALGNAVSKVMNSGPGRSPV